MTKKQTYTLVTLLLGVFMGALDTGIIAPALTTITDSLKVSTEWGVWTITIYSLAYAVSMPIMGKLSDRYGRKKLYIIGLSLFGIGSLLSATSTSLPQLLVARALQAIGGGGIFPIATAEVAEVFPKEKRGMALGFIGATFGIANILAPNIGGFILDHWNWHGIFYINIPLVIVALLLAWRLEESARKERKPLDFPGTISLSLLILSFMYALTNLNSADLWASVTSPEVWAFVLAALGFLVLFVRAERKAEDPVLRLEYFSNKEIALGLLISSFTGIGLASMFFLPSYAQNVVGLTAGQSGYVVTPLVLASGILAPISGLLVDRIGAKKVILMGFFFLGVGNLLFAVWVSSLPTMVISELFIGAGLAFTMGTPVNYLILDQVKSEEAGSALGILSVFRSVGTTIGPIILVGFLGTASLGQRIGTAMKEVMEGYLAAHPELAGQAAAFMPQMSELQFTSLEDFSKLEPYLPPELYNELYIKAEAVVQGALVQGYHDLYLAAAVAAGIGLLLTLLLKGKDTEKQIAV